MRLMQRPHITTLALPRSDTWQATALVNNELLEPHEAPFHFLPDVEQYARFMLASPEQLILDLTMELDVLDVEENSLRSVNDELGASFVVRAREKCLGMLSKAQEMEQDAIIRIRIEKKRNLLQEALNQAKARRRREASVTALATPSNGATSTPDDSPNTAILNPIVPPPRAARNRRNNLNPPPHSSSSYYFFQAASGANVFLHPLDIRILLAHFGSYSAFPNDIAPVLESTSESTVDDDIRKRCKYLGHLPEGADVVFVEVDLESVVGEEALKPFENLLRTRRLRHKERAKKEDKARLRAEEKERETIFAAITSSSSFTPSSTPRPPFPSVYESTQVTTGAVSSPVMSTNVDPEPFPPDDEHHHPSLSITDQQDYPDLSSSYERESVIGSPRVPGDTPDDSAGDAYPPSRGSNSNTGHSSGAWGARSFSSAAQTSAAAGSRSTINLGRSISHSQSSAAHNLREEDEWEIDQAWHELEEAQLKVVGGRNGSNGAGVGGGKRNRGKKLVLLGSGARRAR